MATFSVILVTASPTQNGADAAGAFVKVDGRECLLRSVELFLNRDNIKQIQLVVSAEAMEESKRKYAAHLGFSGVKLLASTPRWTDQIAAAGEKLSAECSHVIIHDAARPIVAYSDIDALMDQSEKSPVAMLATPPRNALAELDGSGQPVAIRPATHYMQILTPWCLRKDKFQEMANAKKDPPTDQIHLLKASPLNMRVNSAADAMLAKAMIGMLPKPKMRAAENPFDEAQW